MSEASPTMNNSVEQYGVEMEFGTELKQAVSDEDGTRIVTYKPFIKDGEVTIYPVNDSGQIIEGGKPIFQDGRWQNLTEPKYKSNRTSTYQTNTTISGIGFIDTDGDGITEPVGETFEQLKVATRNYNYATNGENPGWAEKDGPSTVDELQSEVDRIKAEIAAVGTPSGGKTSEDNRTLNNLYRELRKAEKDLATQIEFENKNQQVASGDMEGTSGAAERAKYNFDNDADIMFSTPMLYPSDLNLFQDHMRIECFAYEPPYSKAFEPDNKGGAFGIQRGSPYRKKLGAGIYLPMPNQIMDGNQRMWTESNMNNQALDAIRSSSKNMVANKVIDMIPGMGQANAMFRNFLNFSSSMTQQSGRADFMANQISQLVGRQGYDISSDQILARSAGVIANANTELLFSGVSLRTFEYSWVMSPRSSKEAGYIRMILRAFKQWSAPRKTKKIYSGDTLVDSGGGDNRGTGQAGGPTYFLGTPNIFKLRFCTAGNKNILGVNKFKACALTDITVNYTPEGRWMAFEGGQPAAVSMTLKFNELEPIYNTDYSSDIQEGRNMSEDDTGDLLPVLSIVQDTPETADVGY